MKSLTRFIALACNFGLIALPVLGQSAAATHAFSRGCEQMMHKDFSSAISSFTEAISDDASDVNSYFRRGQSFFCVGNYKEAIVDFDRALDKGASDFNLYLWKGTAYAKLDNENLAVFNYEKAMRLNPKLIAPFKASADKTAEKSGLEVRIEAVRAAAANIGASKLTAGTTTAEPGSGAKNNATLSLGSNQSAIDAYKTAARKITENEIGYFRAGTTYSGLLNLSGEVIPLSGFNGQPEWVESTQKGRPFLTLKDPRRDLRDLDSQIIMHPQDATLYFQRARASQQLNKSKETLNDLNRAIELDGTNPNYYLARAFYYHQLNNADAADTEIRRAQEVDPIVPSELSFEVPKEKESGKS